jgi:hypothetical protein
MSPYLPVKIFLLLSFFILFAGISVKAQQAIEKYLVEQDLVSASQLKKYKDKEKASDEYVRLMIKLMKGEKGEKKYKREMKKEYKEEIKKKEQNKDTLSILADILEETREERPYRLQTAPQLDLADTADRPVSSNIFKRNVNDSIQDLALIHYVSKLRSRGLITKESEKKLSEHIKNDNICDSSRIVKNAIGIRTKEIATSKPKLIGLMNLLKNLEVLSKQKHEQLINGSFPDSISKVVHIISNCEKTMFFKHATVFFIDGKKEFDQLIVSLSRLAEIKVTNPSLRLVELQSTPQNYRYIIVIELYYNGKKFIHEGNETMSTQKNNDIYEVFGQNFYKVFNKILIYKNSPYRVHEIQERNPPDYVYSPWNGYILLNRSQSDRLYRDENVEISYEENISPLTEENLLKAIDLYKKVGLFDKVTQDDIDSVLNDIKENPVFRYNELIGRFSTISIINDERFRPSPEELVIQIKKMAQLSDHYFDPKNIRVEKDSTGKNHILFELNNKTYPNDAYDPWTNTWGMINHATFIELKENPFQVLRIDQKKEVIIFLPSEKMKILEKEKVIGDW